MTAKEAEAAEVSLQSKVFSCTTKHLYKLGDDNYSDLDELDESSANDQKTSVAANSTTFLPDARFLGGFSVMRAVDEVFPNTVPLRQVH
jgi:hypothetical protein